MKKHSGSYPALAVDGHGSSVVPNAGAVLLLRTAQTVGLATGLSDGLGPWRRPTAVHDPGKVLLNLTLTLAVGGDCLADVAQLRSAPEVFEVVVQQTRPRRATLRWWRS